MTEKNKKVLMPRSLPAFFFLTVLVYSSSVLRRVSLQNVVRDRGALRIWPERQVLGTARQGRIQPESGRRLEATGKPRL